jgi:hypothetical protein
LLEKSRSMPAIDVPEVANVMLVGKPRELVTASVGEKFPIRSDVIKA